MRGAQDVGQIEKGILHAKLSVKERLRPPRIDANQEVGMALCMVVEGLFIDNSATGYID